MSNKILLNVGFGNSVSREQIQALILPGSAPVKRYIREKREKGELIDATMGKKVRAVVVTLTGVVVLSAISAASLAARLEDSRSDGEGTQASA